MTAATGTSYNNGDAPQELPPMTADHVLTLNGGSSSVKFALFAGSSRVLAGAVERLGTPGAALRVGDDRTPIAGDGPEGLLRWLADRGHLGRVAAVGHRIVHGGPDHVEPQRIDPALLADLRRLAPLDPDHLPAELKLIDAVAARRPDLPQVACFDTAFHATLPPVARLLPIPRRYGLRRFGFHGLSYAYLMEELRRLAPAEANGRVILAHLGSGASLAAAKDGVCVDTTMGFTPTGGLVMGTRTGDLDPGVLVHLTRAYGLTADQLDRLVNHESGLKGVSETSSDLRDLTASADPRAAEAVELFCYQATKHVGALAAVLGGPDTLVFSGGIGENAPAVRSRVCETLGFLGLTLDAARNARGDGVISAAGSRVTVRVIRTDEEAMIARTVTRVLTPSPEPP